MKNEEFEDVVCVNHDCDQCAARQPEIDALQEQIGRHVASLAEWRGKVRELQTENAALKAEVEKLRKEMNPLEPRYRRVACSACGGEFGPDDHGYSHCESHQGKRRIG